MFQRTRSVEAAYAGALQVPSWITITWHPFHPTAANSTLLGMWDTGETDSALNIPAGYVFKVYYSSCAFRTGSTSGTYTVDAKLQAVDGTDYIFDTVTGAQNTFIMGTKNRQWRRQPPIVAVAGGSGNGNSVRIGWTNKNTSPGALLADGHSVTVCGVIVPI